MSLNLITGYAGKPHVTSADDGALNAGIIGNGKYVLNIGNRFSYELISNNLIKVRDGYAINQGRKMGLTHGDYEECEIDNGLQGVKRVDLIVMRYEKNINTGMESGTMVVIKGTSGDDYVDPEYITGDILSGALIDDFPLYRVKIDGLSIDTVETMFNIRDSYINYEDKLLGKISELKSSLIDKIYPVGSIYLSANNVSPETFIGGTWEQIKDRFLLSAGVTYKAGDTGGEASHALTTSEMPQHNHSYSGTTGNESNGHTHGFSATTGTVSEDHSHSGSTSDSGNHVHGVGIIKTGQSGSNQWRTSSAAEAQENRATFRAGNHAHTFSTGGISANHVHGVSGTTGDRSANHTHNFSGNTENAGSGAAHNNMPPYLAVYMWKRTA